MRDFSPKSELGVDITAREAEILDLLTRHGYLNREIALTLGIGERTVKAHLARVMRKAKVNSRTALVKVWLSRPQAPESAVQCADSYERR